jgi:transcriptional regulator GlxA family with amidase domain
MERDFATLGGVTELANQLRVSPAHLSRLYRQQTGSTLKEAFLHVRIRHAAQLLYGSQLPIAEVALMSGFSSGNYFAKVFGRVIGTSPGRFRREARELKYSDVIL